ncbi:MAG: hypothetical protein D6706_13270 [Chloroflexi bacterium]|nr:MAG: hypothetical protein D6706_13270 [Chloroflexota bacterium]
MSKHHQLKMKDVKYPGGLRIFECQQCRYAFAAEVDENDVILVETRVYINFGDPEASHSFFQAPDEMPKLTVEAEASAEEAVA